MKHVKYLKIFLKKKETNDKKGLKKISSFYIRRRKKKQRYHPERSKNLSGEQKHKLVEYRRNHYLRHNK